MKSRYFKTIDNVEMLHNELKMVKKKWKSKIEIEAGKYLVAFAYDIPNRRNNFKEKKYILNLGNL